MYVNFRTGALTWRCQLLVGLLYDVSWWRSFHHRVRSYSNLRATRVLTRLDQLLEEASRSEDEGSRQLLLSEARAFLSEQLSGQEKWTASASTCGQDGRKEQQVRTPKVTGEEGKNPQGLMTLITLSLFTQEIFSALCAATHSLVRSSNII